jgi:hypothetical protein
MQRGEFALATSGDVDVHEEDDVLVLIGCMQEAGERRAWREVRLWSGVDDVFALAKWEEVLRWRFNAIK